jgi:hypothetical protein
MIGYEDLTWTGDRLRYGRRTRRAGFLQTDNPLSLAGQQGGRHCAERRAGIRRRTPGPAAATPAA